MHLEPRRPGSTPAPHPAQTRAPSSSSLPTRQRVGRKTSGPRQRGFWQRGDKRSVGTGGPLWMPFPLHLGWRQCGPRNPGAAPRPSCNGTSRVFRGVWPLDPQSKGFYAGNWRAWSSGGPASDCPVVELKAGCARAEVCGPQWGQGVGAALSSCLLCGDLRTLQVGSRFVSGQTVCTNPSSSVNDLGQPGARTQLCGCVRAMDMALFG